MTPPSRSAVVRRTIVRVAVVLAGSLLLMSAPAFVIGELPGERWLAATQGRGLLFGLTGAGLLALDVLLPVPSSVIGALLGGRLGMLAGFGWTFVGLTAGHAIGYGLGRAAPARWATALPSASTTAVVFLSRPVPVLAEAVALAAGAERMPLLSFAASAAAGNAIYAAAMAATGAAVLPDGLVGPGLVVPMLVPVISWLLWRRLAAR